MKVVRIALLLLVLAATGTASAGPPPVLPRLHVRQVIAKGSPLPVEGSFSYIAVVRPNGTKVVQRRLSLTRTPSGTVALPAGRYRLRSWQRYCDGNCTRLDPPADRCSRGFTISRGERLRATITVRFGSGCTIRFG